MAARVRLAASARPGCSRRLTRAAAPPAALLLLIALVSGCTAGDRPPSREANEQARLPSPFGIDPTGDPTDVVGPFELHIDPAASRLAEAQQLVLLDVVRPVLLSVAEALDSPRASIVIEVDPDRAIPEVGTGGATDPFSGNVRIRLDDATRPDIKDTLTTALPRSLAHELAHSARILDGPGPGLSLLDVMVQEGLADQFAQELLGTPAPPWTQALTPEQARELWGRAQPLLDKRDPSLQRAWLFGGEGIPKWTAYTLGSGIVDAYLDGSTEVGWGDLMRRDSRQMLKASDYAPGGQR